MIGFWIAVYIVASYLVVGHVVRTLAAEKLYPESLDRRANSNLWIMFLFSPASFPVFVLMVPIYGLSRILEPLRLWILREEGHSR